MTKPRVRVVELNTMDNPPPGFMDETPRIKCIRCGNLFRLGIGMDYDPTIAAISEAHVAICDGDPAMTLWRIDQLVKTGNPSIAVDKVAGGRPGASLVPRHPHYAALEGTAQL